jgi:hypothetical protein
MEASLTFEYDEAGDILYINKVAPYPEQETEQLAYNMLARRNPRTQAIENLEILFFTRWLVKQEAASPPAERPVCRAPRCNP